MKRGSTRRHGKQRRGKRRQESARTVWHVLFALLVGERRPPQVEVRFEVVLTREPQRADLLLLQRLGVPRADEQATVLRGLWPHLSRDTLVEYKSVTRPPRRGDWSRLLGYGAQYFSAEIVRLERASELTLVMVVPSLTPTLRQDIEALGGRLVPMQPGYVEVGGLPFATYLVLLAEAAEAEKDDLLRWFGGGTIELDETRWWIMAHATTKDGTTKLSEREGYREMLQSLLSQLPPEERGKMIADHIDDVPLEQRLAGLAPEQRLAGLAPEQRLAGLAPGESVLALPDEILERLPKELLATLPEPVQARIRERLASRRAD